MSHSRLELLKTRFSEFFSADSASPEESDQPKVQLEIRRRLRATMLFAVASLVPTSVLFSALLWNHASPRGLVLFVLGSAATLFAHWYLHLRLAVAEDWSRRLTIAQAIGGLSWGLMPVLAMPDEPQWQAFVGSMLLGVLAANSVFGSLLRNPCNFFNGCLMAPALVAFVMLDNQFGVAVAVLLGFAGIFATALASITRSTNVSAAVLGVRSLELAEGLRVERELLAKQVRTDQLTGLPNRSELMERLEAALADSTAPGRVGLAYLDIDGFKRVNDSMGHLAGDQLLRAVAGRLLSVLNPEEVAARLSGDELTVLFPSALGGGSGEEISARLLTVFAQPFELEGYTIEVTASIGVAFNEEGTSPDNLLSQADTALYRAKNSGRAGAVVFDSALRRELASSEQLESLFEEAYWAGLVVPYFQPYVDISTGRIVGAESLLRWIDGNRVRTAGSFLDIVHKLKLGARVDLNVLLQITEFNQIVKAEFGAPLPVSLNVSPNHIDQFLDLVDPSQLSQVRVEITEETTLPSLADLRRAMSRIQAMGGQVVLDDFGVGYSSLERLTAWSVDGLKIDRQFVALLDQDSGAEAIVASIVELSNRMGLHLVAEGIETESQAKMLGELGVTVGQGFLYSAAVPMDEFLTIYRQGVRLGSQTDSRADSQSSSESAKQLLAPAPGVGLQSPSG